MDFEFDVVLKSGREVSVVATATIDYRCECCDQPHIENIEYTSVMDTMTGMDVIIDDVTRRELDAEADAFVYDELAA